MFVLYDTLGRIYATIIVLLYIHKQQQIYLHLHI